MSMPIQPRSHRSNNNNFNNSLNCAVASRNPLGAMNNEDLMMNSDDYGDLKYHTGLSGNYNYPGLDDLNLNNSEKNGLNGSNHVDVNTFGNRLTHGSNRRAFSNVEFVQQKNLEQKQHTQKHHPPPQQQPNSKGRKGLSGSHRWLTGLRSRSVSSPVVTGGEDKNRLFNGKEVNTQDNQQYWLRNKLKNKEKNAYLEKKYMMQQQQLQDQKQKQEGFKAKRFFTTGAVGSNRYDYDEQDNDGKEEEEGASKFYVVGNNNFVNLDPVEVKKEKKIRRWSVSSQYQQPLVLSQNGSTRGKPSIVSTPNAYFTDKETSNNNPTFKSDHILCFDRIPEYVGLNSIISQVSGGPLERILNVGAESSSNPRIVQLHFFQAADALAFYEYTTTGRFMINGTSYKPRWGHASLSVVYTFPKVVYDEMMYNGARRCIYLMFRRKNQVAPHRVVGNENGGKEDAGDVKHNADCTVSYMPCNGVGATGGSNWKPKAMVSSRNVGLDVSLETIQKDFGKFGQVLSVCPLISHHVNISIQYADVQDAIRAKKVFDRQSDEDIVKRYSQWTVIYGKDPTDRRVPVSL